MAAIIVMMGQTNDRQLLDDYVSGNSQEAFETLVQRHLDFVYSVALRRVGDPDKAHEVTQAVFILLARKAARLRRETVLAGWLHTAARLTSATFLRGEVRRGHREQQALMEASSAALSGEAPWEELAPVLDEAIARLGDNERNAILLRYFEGRSVAEVALALGLTEHAARKRLGRALERLRRFFGKRGIAVSVAALAGAVAANSVQAGPAWWAPAIASTAVAKGAGASLSSLALAKATLKLMTWLKLKTAVLVGAASLLAAGAVGVVGLSVASVVRQHAQAAPSERSEALPARAERLAASGPRSNQVPEPAGQGQAPQHPPSVRLLGEVERSAADAGGHPLAHYWSRFEAILTGNQWHITVYLQGDPNYFEEWAYDGRDCKCGFLQAGRDFDPTQPADPNTHWIGCIYRGPLPNFNSTESSFLWLALGSREFLKEDRTGTMPAPWMPGGGLLGERHFHYQTSRFEQNGGLPQALTLRASAKLRRVDREKQGSLPFPILDYPDGFVAAEYKVLSSTNIQGTTIPLSFEMNQFAPVRGWLGTTGERFLFSKYSARVTALDLNGREASLPRIYQVPQAVIYDQRFEDQRRPGLHITWSPVGGSWPAADSPEVPALLAKAVRDYDSLAHSRPPPPGARLMKGLTQVSCFTLGLLLTLSLAVWISRRRQRRN